MMCCKGLVPVALWCWCFVCWSSQHPARRLLFKAAPFPSDSPPAAGALKLNPAMLEVEKKVACGLLLEKTSWTKNFLKEL